MKNSSLAVAAVALLAATAVQAQDQADTPYGPDDQAGASNTQTPEKALEAAQLITEGNVIDLARVYEPEMPLFGTRVFALRGTGGLAGGPFGDNGVIWNDDFIATEIGQVGTQFDGLGHIGRHTEQGSEYYGGRTDIHGSYGLTALGVENVLPFFTRGVLIDVEAHLGSMPDAGTEITVDDLTAAMEAQGLDPDSIAEGDVVLIHTGWGSLWKEDNERFNAGEPGIGVEAGTWLAEKGVAIVGSDTWGLDVVPNPDETQVFPVHQVLLVDHGVYILENVATERLKEAGVNEFAFSFNPMPIKGGTGAPGNALAIR